MLASLLTLVTSLALAHPPSTAAAPSGIEPTKPRYVLDLTLEEFSVLHSAADHGVSTYNGHCEFKVDIFRTTQGLNWQVSIEEPKLLPVWSQWMAEKTTELVSVTDVDQLSDADRLAYRVTRSVNQKIKDALQKPIFDAQRMEGTAVKLPDGASGLQLAASGQTVRVIGAQSGVIASSIGQRMMVDATVTSAGELQAAGAYPARPGVLEVFVISQCPFGKAAEKAILERLAQANMPGAPTVEFRYLFIPVDKTATFTCMHGEKELVENLVQMVIRDQFPSSFASYLLKRTGSDAPWQELAQQVGLDPVSVDFIEAEIVRNRDALMGAEYAHWKARSIPHESPTYLWEGRPVKSLDAVPGLKGITLQPGSCGG